MTQRLCEYCKQPFNPNEKQAKTQQARQRFCTIACRNAANAKRKPIIKGQPCSVCGKIGYGRKHGACQEHYSWLPEHVEYIKAHYANDGAQDVATALGLTAKYVRNRANKMGLKLTDKARHRIVHSKARAYMLQSNPMKQTETIDKVKAWRASHPDEVGAIQQSMMEGHQRIQRNKASRPEMKLRAILTELHIDFEPAALIKPKFLVDVRIGALIIQVDGEYWHGHPRFEPLTERQQKQRARDCAQDSYLHTCGYAVVRVWERDITFDNITAILRQHGLLSYSI